MMHCNKFHKKCSKSIKSAEYNSIYFLCWKAKTQYPILWLSRKSNYADDIRFHYSQYVFILHCSIGSLYAVTIFREPNIYLLISFTFSWQPMAVMAKPKNNIVASLFLLQGYYHFIVPFSLRKRTPCWCFFWFIFFVYFSSFSCTYVSITKNRDWCAATPNHRNNELHDTCINPRITITSIISGNSTTTIPSGIRMQPRSTRMYNAACPGAIVCQFHGAMFVPKIITKTIIPLHYPASYPQSYMP